MFTHHEKLLIGRYLFPAGEGRIVILVAAIGLTAVAIGVAALIVVMSVMNGARTKLSMQFAGINGHASVSRPGEMLADWRVLRTAALRSPGIRAAVPALDASAMASTGETLAPVTVRGLRPEDMRADPQFASASGSLLGRLPRNDEEIVVGAELATRLGASIGAPMTVMRAVPGADGALSVESGSYLVTGFLQTGLPQYDGTLILMNMDAAQTMLKSGDVASRVNLTTKDADRAAELIAPLAAGLRGRALVQSWRDLNRALFDALALDQVGMFLGLSLIVLVALFNIMSSLVMLVRSKRRDIGILRTMGASRLSILKIFIAIGTAIGVAGTALGSGVGLLLVAAKNEIALFLKANLLAETYTPELSLVIDLPAEIGGWQLAGIMAMAVAGSIVATLYPALKALSVQPASMLRHH